MFDFASLKFMSRPLKRSYRVRRNNDCACVRAKRALETSIYIYIYIYNIYIYIIYIIYIIYKGSFKDPYRAPYRSSSSYY